MVDDTHPVGAEVNPELAEMIRPYEERYGHWAGSGIPT